MMRTLPLQRTLELVAGELAEMALLANRAANALAHAMRDEGPVLHRGFLQDAQGLDELSQRITGLRDYLERLSRAAPAGVDLPASACAASLPLDGQMARLSGRSVRPPSAGEADLF